MLQKIITEIRDELCKESNTDLFNAFISNYISGCITQSPVIKNIQYTAYALVVILLLLLIVNTCKLALEFKKVSV